MFSSAVGVVFPLSAANWSGDFELEVASRHARAAISSGQRLRSTAEQWFRAQSTPCAVFSSVAYRVTSEKEKLGLRLRVLPNTKKRARVMISSARWPRGAPEQQFRAASGYGAWPSSDFERKARPVRCFRVLPAWLVLLSVLDWSGGFTI